MADSGPEPEGFLRGIAEVQREAASGRRLPPVESWNPPDCGAIDMRIARDGTWFYQGTPIGRPAMVRLFSTLLRREADGNYVLVTPVEKVRIQVEDAPFMALLAGRKGEGRDQHIQFTTNVGDVVEAGAEHPIRVVTAENGEPAPYVHVRGRLEARIARAAFYDLVAMGEQRESIMGVWSRGVFFPLGPING